MCVCELWTLRLALQTNGNVLNKDPPGSEFSLQPGKEKEECREAEIQTTLDAAILQPLSNEVSYAAGGPIHLNPSGKRAMRNISQSKYFLTNLLIMHSNKLFAACGGLLLDFLLCQNPCSLFCF